MQESRKLKIGETFLLSLLHISKNVLRDIAAVVKQPLGATKGGEVPSTVHQYLPEQIGLYHICFGPISGIQQIPYKPAATAKSCSLRILETQQDIMAFEVSPPPPCLSVSVMNN